MVDATELRTRAATLADTDAIAAIYNEGIADRVATFETEPRSAAQIAEWVTGGQLVIVADTEETGPVAFAASFPYSARPCYAGIGEFLGLCKAGLSPRRWPRGPHRADRSG